MKTSLFKLQLLLIALLLGFNSGRAELVHHRTVAMFIPTEKPEEIDDNYAQEKAAAQLFEDAEFRFDMKDRYYTFKKFITPSTIDEISYPNIDCLWIHFDRKGLKEGVDQLYPELQKKNPDFLNNFIQKVRKFHQDGGNLYLSKYAVQLLFPEGIDRLPAYLKPNVFKSPKEEEGEGSSEDIWSINPEIGAKIRDTEFGDQYIDQRYHSIYAGLDKMDNSQWPKIYDFNTYQNTSYEVYPMQGKSNKDPMLREDHNCMWRVAYKDDNNTSIAIYTGFDGVSQWSDLYDENGNMTQKCKDINAVAPQELAALYFLLCPESDLYKLHPNITVKAIGPDKIADIMDDKGNANFDCIWIHIDRCGLIEGYQNLPDAYKNEDLINALKAYCKDGRALLLTKQATQLIPALGRISEDFAPNIFYSGDGGKGTDIWSVNAQIGWMNRDADPTQFYDHRDHAIYKDMETNMTQGYETFSLEGTGNGTEMWREDHNCMWDLNGFSYSADGKNTVEKFENQNNATVLGTWGQTQNYDVAGIVEFRPTPDFRGRIIANGLAAYEFAPRSGANAYQKNIEKLTLNCLDYLCKVTDFRFYTEGPNGVACFQGDANAKVLGTWGQDWDHSAAGIVEFLPTVTTYADNNDNSNDGKAARGSVIANGIACVQYYHAENNKNDFQGNVNKLTTNTLDYLTPWHYEDEINLGVENVSGDSAKGKVSASEGRITWTGFAAPVLLEVYSVDGSLLRSMMIEGEGSADIDARGIVVINAGGSVCKAIL